MWAQLAQAEEYFAQGNISGLMGLLERGHAQTQIKAAGYLADLKAVEAVPLLQRLADAWDSAPRPDANPFTAAIEKILRQTPEPNDPQVQAIDAEPNEPNAPAEPNEAAELEGPQIAYAVHVIDDEGRGIPDVKASIVSGQPRYSYYYYGQSSGRGAKSLNGVTDANGVCRFDVSKDVPNNPKLTLFKEGHVSLEKPLADIESGGSIQLVMDRAVHIGGVIADWEGRPIADAYVRVTGNDPDREKDGASARLSLESGHRTDAQGFWQCGIVPGNLDELQIHVSHPDYESKIINVPQPHLQLDDLFLRRSTIALRAGSSLQGMVLDPQGQPVHEAVVMLGYGYPVYRRVNTTVTDANGHFAFAAVDSWSRHHWEVLVRATGYAPQVRECALTRGRNFLEFALDEARTVTGTVVDQGGAPIEEVFVRIQAWQGSDALRYLGSLRARTDREGRFVLDDVPLGDVCLSFASSPYETAFQIVAAHEKQIEVTLAPREPSGASSLKVTVRVFDKATGLPRGGRKAPGRLPGMRCLRMRRVNMRSAYTGRRKCTV
jgi:protocatechuate 3,4-dioxygenase beta subunit